MSKIKKIPINRPLKIMTNEPMIMVVNGQAVYLAVDSKGKTYKLHRRQIR